MIPFLMEKIFQCFYFLIEIPVALLHQKFGASFYKIDNWLSQTGEHVDSAIRVWYKSWHSAEKMHIRKSLLIYGVCVAFIVVPSLLKLENHILGIGETLYIRCETLFVNWLEERGWYDSAAPVALNGLESKKKNNSCEITLVVSGVNSSLMVRDIPSTENCVILDRLQNDDIVIWGGQLVFAEAEDGHIEPWVKIITEEGAEGWSRLFYLHPEQYQDIQFYINN